MRMILNWAVRLCVFLSLGIIARADNKAVLRSEFIYDTAPFPSCHASTIVEAPTGLVAAWFGGTAEGKPDVGIWLSRHVEGRWKAPTELATGLQADGTRYPCWNPVLFQPPGKHALLLFYKVGPSPSRWWGEVRSSADAGQTWSPARRLPEGILGPVKNKPVALADGVILSGSSTEGHAVAPSWRLHFERSDDGGVSWSRVDVPVSSDSPASIQPSLLTHGDGRLQALGRTRSGQLFSTVSRDQGRSWTSPSLLSLPNPNSGTDAVTLADGRHLLIYNHTPKGRTPLNVSVSRDGVAWDAALVLEREPGEYSYPAIIQSADGLVHATYTWRRQKIKHVVLDPRRLATRPIVEGRWPE